MGYNTAAKSETISTYAVFYIDAPAFPAVERFIYKNRKTVYINLAANADANIVKLIL